MPLTDCILSKRVVLLVVARRADLAVDLVAAAQLEAADLRQRHVDVGVGLGVALRAQETVSVGQHVQQARPELQTSILGLLVQDLHDQILLGVLAEVLDAQLSGDHVQVGEQLGLQFRYGRLSFLGGRIGSERLVRAISVVVHVHSSFLISFIASTGTV